MARKLRMVLLLATVLVAGSPVQASAQAILDTILDKVNDAVAAANNARNAANSARDAATAAKATADEMRTRMQSGVTDLTGDLAAMIDEAAAEARRILAEENAGRDAFLPGGNCAATCTDFRNDLIELLTTLEALSQSVVASTKLTADPDLSTLIDSVRVAPGQVLYPLYRVTQPLLASNLSARLSEAATDVDSLSTLALNGPPDLPDACAVLTANRQNVERGIRGVSIAGAIVKIVGKVFMVVGSTEFEGYAAGWGFVGGTIKSNKPKKVGEFLSGVGDGMGKIASYGTGKLQLCATLAFQAETATALSLISSSLAALDLDLSGLDAPVSTRASQASVDAVNASVARVGVDVTALVAAQQAPGGGSSNALMLRIQIERELAEKTSPMAVFYLPAPFGGLLDTVRETVEEQITQHESAGQMQSQARRFLARGDDARDGGDYLRAYTFYRDAYQRLSAR